MPGANKMLNAPDPIIVPTPMSPFVTKVPTKLVNSSGEDVPIAIIVAPATFGDMFSTGMQS